jgi:hypothetical protein
MSVSEAKPPALPALAARRVTVPLALSRVALRLAPIVLGLACWGLSLAHLRIQTLGPYGLLAAVDAWFYVGIALLLGGFVAEFRRAERSSWVMTLHVLALVVVIYATVPLLFHAPEYAWVYKHVGVAQSLRVHGRVTDTTNIYQEWPAFFSAVAGISSLSGVGPLSFAAWAPLFFELANCVMLLAVFRGMSRDDRVPVLAVLLFVGFVSWVGQDYLSPQAFAYLLWLGLVLLILRWLTVAAPLAPARSRLGRLRRALLTGMEYRQAPSTGVRRAATAMAIGIFFVIVAAHQLTPFIALIGLVVLGALDLLRPRWLVIAFAAIAFGYVFSRYHLLSTEYGGIFSGFNVVENASGSVKAWGSQAQAFTASTVRALSLGMWLLALAALARSIRRPGRFLVPAVLAFSPFAILLVQSYGGEAIYRVFLFSAPWCAFLIATAIVELPFARLRLAVAALLPSLALLAGLQGLFGPITANAFTPAELNASLWFYRHTPPGSTLVLAVDDFPVLETASYEHYRLEIMPSDPQVGPDWLNAGDLPLVNLWVSSLKAPNSTYLVLSRTMLAYSNYYGFPGGFKQLKRELTTSPDWTVYHTSKDTIIYRFTPPGVTVPSAATAAAAEHAAAEHAATEHAAAARAAVLARRREATARLARRRAVAEARARAHARALRAAETTRATPAPSPAPAPSSSSTPTPTPAPAHAPAPAPTPAPAAAPVPTPAAPAAPTQPQHSSAGSGSSSGGGTSFDSSE